MKKSIIKIALCLIAVLFAVSCGKDANSSMTPITMDDTYDFKVYLDRVSINPANYDRINVSSDRTKVSKASSLKFSMTPGIVKEAQARITDVKKDNASSLVLDISDFTIDSTITDLTESVLTLTQSGINKVKTASLTAATEYIYNVDITFTSDNEKLKNKETVVTVPIKILVIKNVTKIDIENIIKKVGSSGTITISGGKASFDLSSFTLSQSGSTITSTGDGGGTYKAYDVAALFNKITDDNLQYSPYAETSPISGDGKTADFTITLQFKDGYEIEDSNYAFVNKDGIKLSLKLNGNIRFLILDGTIGKIGLVEYVLKIASVFRNPIAMMSPGAIMDIIRIPEGNFDKITGELAIKDNVVNKINIKSYSPTLSALIKGRFDMEKHDTSLRIYTRFSSDKKTMFSFLRNISLSALANKVQMNTRNDANYYQSELVELPEINVANEKTQVFLTQVEGDVEHNNFLSSLKKIK